MLDTPTSPRLHRGFPFALLALALLFASLTLSGAEAPKVKFDVAAGEASKTLKIFAKQAQREIIFPEKAVGSVKTSPVRGEFSVREALSVMLAGTDLSVFEDEKTGSLAIETKKAIEESKNVPSRPVADRAASLSGTGRPESRAGRGKISGRVFDGEHGVYLSRARVTIVETGAEVLTNDIGEYSFSSVRPGALTLKVYYSARSPITQSVTVGEGEAVIKNFEFSAAGVMRLDEFVVEARRFKNAVELANNEERYSPTIKNVVDAGAFGHIPDGNVGEFVKYIPGVQIDYGYTGTGLNAADNNATSISVRGFASEFTAITMDGVPLTNASPAALTRSIGLDMMSINNASRVEVIKVPTPDMPSNSPGGAINLVSKTAFEYAKPALTVRGSVNVNSEDTDKIFSKTPGPATKATYKTLPNVELSYVMPVNDKFGIAVNGAWSKTFNENHRGISDWYYSTKDVNTATSFTLDLRPGGGPLVQSTSGNIVTPVRSASGAALDLNNPALWRFQAIDTPNQITRSSGAIRADWKPSPAHRFTFAYTFGIFTAVDAQRRLQFNPSKGYFMDWAPTFMTSYKFLPVGTVVNGTPLTSTFNPGATVNQTVTTRDRDGTTHTGYINYEFKRGPWQVSANANASRSRGSYHDFKNGHFAELESTITGGQMAFLDIKESIPGRIVFNDQAGNPLDWSVLKNWNAPTITAKSGETESMDQKVNFKLDVQRQLEFLPIDATAKVGYYREQHHEKRSGLGASYKLTYYGPTLSLPDYQDAGYRGQTPGFGLPGQEWLDTYKLYKLWQANPSYFNGNSDADLGNNYQSFVNQQRSITETSNQYYGMLSGKGFANRFSWITGIRQQTATRKGYAAGNNGSWNFVKNKDGTIYRDATHPQGVRIDQAASDLFASTTAGTTLRAQLTSAGLTYPTNVVSSSTTGGTYYQYSQLRFIPYSPANGHVTQKPSYMASTAYNLTKDLTARLSWNRSFARPDFENGVLTSGGTTGVSITENADPNAASRGTIAISNPNLKPWTADSYDFQLAYYTPNGGKVAVSPFLKYTRDFHETLTVLNTDPQFAPLLESYGLDPTTYRDYTVQSAVNGKGTAKTAGYELEVNQNLGFLGEFARSFTVFASYSHQYIKQQQTTQLTAKPTSSNTASGGIAFENSRFSILARALYVEQRYLGGQSTYNYQGQPAIVSQYNPSEVKLDVNTSLKLSRRYSLFFDARNVLNRTRDTVKFDAAGVIPEYARHVDRKLFGVQLYLGVEGRF